MVKFQFNSQLPSNAKNAHGTALVSKIKQLEGELQQKDRALTTVLKEYIILRESLEACVTIFQKVTSQLNKSKNDLINNSSQVFDHIEGLEQEKRVIGLANDAWSNRSINLEFDLLTAKEEIRTVKASYDLVVNQMALMEIELTAVKLENQRLKQHRDK